MQKKKAVFFDVDGTLWDFNNYIPDSTVEAIRSLRKNGHLAFICTGRCRAHIYAPELLQIGFDGIISACGTMIEYNGETLFYKKLENDLVARTIEVLRRYGAHTLLEGREYIYVDETEFGDDAFVKKIKKELGERLLTISGEWGRWEISKFTCTTKNIDQKACLAELEDDYDFLIHKGDVVELVPKGFDKATGVKRICEILGLDISETFAFGDGVNDFGMLKTVGTGIAMGNGSDTAKAAADYVTAPLREDGIWKACRHFGLI